MRYLLENDPSCGKDYFFVGAFTDRPDASGIEAARAAGIPVEIHDFKAWRKERNIEAGNIDARAEYFKEVVELIKEWRADVLMFSGFMLITTDPLISAYEGRILNVHPADLRIVDQSGQRKYVGPGNVVLERQFEDGLTETCSTIHIVTRGVDEGSIIAVSDPLPIELGVSVHDHQEKMKYACDGPAFRESFRRIVCGEFTLPSTSS